MKLFASALFAGLFLLSAPASVDAGQIIAKVDVSEQIMRVYRDGKQIYKWPVSTARKGKVTPRGAWKAKWLSKDHKSSLYNNAPMPYSIFYSGNFAVHGTNQTSRLGRPASAGCIRLKTSNAAKLFALTQQVGLKNMKVVVQN
ncbi:lipoprotein-anchoring transpeptidase ErfK/SrfK [Sulfitobacter undariae]|uniref:Lipoprotein-anchoring transpeptidase ErfK/SrfK n=1 Tax=Sulfitobacter undariae TaxID=1563671 RepID=A0A7W6E488_9RHOB|nr:L,D-transpeptidase [Sulfitobacter undariae]MBB3993984.1 lipoprotein-anchoring transpeptidase ErfK/SrfK [Sulfitobacter undariae]